tara:strand:+ start:1086 stop:1343 length:258 start_codon:yes stop_codon:yes gene_type:complete
MKLFVLFSLTLAFLIFLWVFKNFNKFSKPYKVFKLSKKNIYIWMNFSKKKRYELLKKDSASYLNQRKNLLKQIRDEYKNISDTKK